MPSPNIIKQYVPGAFYHVYNRGVEKRQTFLDQKDFNVFIKYLRSYQTNEALFESGRPKPNLSNKVRVVAYCLMPNHYHLLLHQYVEDGMTDLIRRVMTAYSGYFNSRYGRVGSLFQSRYKAVQVENDEYLLHVSRYIHLNSKDLGVDPEHYFFSSLKDYVAGSSGWLETQPIFDLVPAEAYRDFVRDHDLDSAAVVEPSFTGPSRRQDGPVGVGLKV